MIFLSLIQKGVEETEEEILDRFYKAYPLPSKDDQIYNDLINFFAGKDLEETFKNGESLSRYFYMHSPYLNFKDYIITMFNEQNFIIHIMIDPCKNYAQYCCENLADCVEENTDIVSKGDLEIAYVVNNFLPKCENEFSEICGTFLEIHMPGNELILDKVIIENYYSSGYKTMFISTKKLCSGKYEIWMVMRIRGNNYLIYTKPFYVKYPSCTCDEVLYHGYECPKN